MPRTPAVLALLCLASAAGACRSSPSEQRLAEWDRGALVHREVRAYHVVVSAHKGRIGYMKVFDVAEAGGPTYPWRYVYDKDWRELGFVDQFGGAYVYHYLSPSEQAQQNMTLRLTKLPADAIQANVMRMFGIDPTTDDVTFPVASKTDITGDTRQNLAGPGVTPATAPAAPAPEPAK